MIHGYRIDVVLEGSSDLWQYTVEEVTWTPDAYLLHREPFGTTIVCEQGGYVYLKDALASAENFTKQHEGAVRWLHASEMEA